MERLRSACVEIFEFLHSVGPHAVPEECIFSIFTMAAITFMAVDAVELDDPEIDELLREQIRALREHLRWCEEMYEEKLALRTAIYNRNHQLMNMINAKLEVNQEEADR